mgnify:CR=1 FL=1
MKKELIADVMQRMLPFIDNAQLKHLQQALEQVLCNYEINETRTVSETDDSAALLTTFLSSKRVDGCSEKTLKY